MRLHVADTINLRGLLVDVYEGDFRKPCAADGTQWTVTPPEVAKVDGDTLTALLPGTAVLSAQVHVGDAWKPAEGAVTIEVAALPVQTVPQAPALVKTLLVDPVL